MHPKVGFTLSKAYLLTGNLTGALPVTEGLSSPLSLVLKPRHLSFFQLFCFRVLGASDITW